MKAMDVRVGGEGEEVD